MAQRLKRPDQEIYVPRHKRDSRDKTLTENETAQVIYNTCECGGEAANETKKKSPGNERKGTFTHNGRQKTNRNSSENVKISENCGKNGLEQSPGERWKLGKDYHLGSNCKDTNILPTDGVSPSHNANLNVLANFQSRKSEILSIDHNSQHQQILVDRSDGDNVHLAASVGRAISSELQFRLDAENTDTSHCCVTGRVTRNFLDNNYDNLLQRKQNIHTLSEFSSILSCMVLEDALNISCSFLKASGDVNNFSSTLSSEILVQALSELKSISWTNIAVDLSQQPSYTNYLLLKAGVSDSSDLKDFKLNSNVPVQDELNINNSPVCNGKQNKTLPLNRSFTDEENSTSKEPKEPTEAFSSEHTISRTKKQSSMMRTNRVKSKPLKKKKRKAVMHDPCTTTAPGIPSPVSNLETKEEELLVDDWESNFDEKGDCIQKEVYERSVLEDEQYEESGGPINYLQFKPKEVTLDIGEFGHILELSEFPSSYKSSDLGRVMKAAGVSDYDLHWVDDTHAVAVFASQVAAHNALKVNMPFIQMKQVVNGTRQSRIKCKDLKDSMLPYKKRPQTTSMVARNLVAGALGMRTNTTREQRTKEKEVIKQAREEKRLKEKQRRDVWDS